MAAIFFLFLFTLAAAAAAAAAVPGDEHPTFPGDLLASPVPTTVPALPLAHSPNDTCRLDLSAELFGGVSLACAASPLDRGRCCPVLAAWLYAAHARTALALPAGADPADDDAAPMVPYDNQRCVDALGAAMEKRGVQLPRPNASCDTVICFCGIRLHQIGSLRCPAAFDVAGAGNGTAAAPTPAVKALERTCRNASYAGCSRCVQSLQKLKSHPTGDDGGGDRERRILNRDCQLMGLTWLLAKNKTAYIPTVSAVLRAMLYSAHPADSSAPGNGGAPPHCSPDQENMPLAVNSLQFQQHIRDASSSSAPLPRAPTGFAVGAAAVAAAFVLGVGAAARSS